MNTLYNKKHDQFTNENLHYMSARFVNKLLNSKHEQLAYIFNKAIKNKEEQILKVASLWQNIYVKKVKDERESKRDNHHTNLSQELMNAWMKEFKESADEVFNEECSNTIVARAKKIAEDTHMIKE